MVKLLKITKQLFKNVSTKKFQGSKEIVITILHTNTYSVCLTINCSLDLICLEIFSKNDNEVVLANFKNFLKHHICLYSFYLKAKEIFIRNNKAEILSFLQDFGMSLSYTHFVSLLGE